MCLVASIAIFHTSRSKIGSTVGQINPDSPRAAFDVALTDNEGRRPKPQHPDEFAKIHLAIRTRDNELRPSYAPNYKITELKRANSIKSALSLHKGAAFLPWVERGPGNVGGRTRGLVADPADVSGNTWFAGSVGGGIWKTTNAGQTWENKTPELPNLATTVLAVAPSNPDVIYAGTGEGFFNIDAISGDGIFKSTDHGETWTQLIGTANLPGFQNVNRIVVDPENENLLLVCANSVFQNSEGSSGIFRSSDGGMRWTQVYDSGSRPIQQIIANPENFNTLYASVNGQGVIKSNDAGLTWAVASSGINAPRRIELAIAPTDTSRIYAAVEVNSRTSDLYVSENGGANWLLAIEDGSISPNWLGAQGWYNNTIAVHPFDEDIVFVGGINLWRLTISPGSSSRQTISSVEENKTASFLSFVNFGGAFFGGALSIGTSFGASDLAAADFVSVEIRFGPGRSQMAHRFSAPDGAGVPFPTYVYEDYVEVPFEVWDITHQRQLMVSFRDRMNDGIYDLIEFDPNNVGREYIFINAVPYDPVNPHPNMAQTGGQIYKSLYFIWPILTTGATWDPGNLPESNFRINYGTVGTKFRRSTQVTNWVPGSRSPNGDFFPIVHADHHNLIALPINRSTNGFRIFNANDGGVDVSNDGGVTWNKTVNGYNTSQFYGVDKKPGADEYIGGLQDNGTWRSPAGADKHSVWFRQLGGDGFEVSWHQKNPNKIIASIQFNDIRRSLNGGHTWRRAIAGLTDLERKAPFITNIADSQSDPELLFAIGASGVWRSDNFADDWLLTPIPPEDWGFSLALPRVKISLANPQIVWAGIRMSDKGKIHVSTDGGVSFRPTSNFAEATLGSITGLATHPREDSTAFVLFSFAKSPKILRTTDLGQTWEDISGFGQNTSSSNGFPDVAVYCLLVLPHNPDEIWVGTEIGLFISTDNGLTWRLADNGLPAVSIWDMKVVDDQIVVATHGRGVWSVTLPELLLVPHREITLTPRLNRLAQAPTGDLEISLSLRSVYDSTQVLINGRTLVTLTNHAPLDTMVTYAVVEAKVATVALAAFRNGQIFRSASRRLDVLPLAEPQVSYVNDFEMGATDFVGEGFEVSHQLGFADNAIHSVHEYPEKTDLIYRLSVPIVVSSSAATMQYDDVALVEPGADFSVFGEQSFKDYVVVEATNNGLNWRPLADGYDARFDPLWLGFFGSAEPGTQDLFRTHTVDLSGHFASGDTILIRFRLFSDASVTGWGWAIDNIRIQDSFTAVRSTILTPDEFSLTQNYPNPFNPTTQINYALPRSSQVTLTIFNVLGRKVRELVRKRRQPAGIHTVEWDGKDDSGTAVASGVYLYRIKAGDFVKSRKMILVR